MSGRESNGKSWKLLVARWSEQVVKVHNLQKNRNPTLDLGVFFFKVASMKVMSFRRQVTEESEEEWNTMIERLPESDQNFLERYQTTEQCKGAHSATVSNWWSSLKLIHSHCFHTIGILCLINRSPLTYSELPQYYCNFRLDGPIQRFC